MTPWRRRSSGTYAIPNAAARGGIDDHRPAAQPDLTLVGRRNAEQNPCQLGPSSADQSGQAEDFTSPNAERDVTHPRDPAAKVSYLEDHLTRLDKCLGKDRRQLAADHHADQVTTRYFVHPLGTDQDAVAQGRHAVGDCWELFKAVRNVDNTDSMRLELGDDPEKPVHFFVTERCSRLVHDQDACVGTQGAGDLDELLLGH